MITPFSSYEIILKYLLTKWQRNWPGTAQQHRWDSCCNSCNLHIFQSLYSTLDKQQTKTETFSFCAVWSFYIICIYNKNPYTLYLQLYKSLKLLYLKNISWTYYLSYYLRFKYRNLLYHKTRKPHILWHKNKSWNHSCIKLSTNEEEMKNV